MAVDLGLTDKQYYMAVALFLVGYIVAEIPSKLVPRQLRSCLSIRS